MNGEVQLIVSSGNSGTTSILVGIDGGAINYQTTIDLNAVTGSPAFPCGDPSIVTLVGGTITVPDADRSEEHTS